jgi:Tfp pilus assembly protein PilV
MRLIAGNKNFQSGQTLIETLVAAFILTMGITAAVGLAIYVFSTSGGITKQMVAIGLAREGIEAVKNMRDTNWLKQPAIDENCYNYETLDSTGKCYKNWLGKDASTDYYCVNPSNTSGDYCNGLQTSRTYILSFDKTKTDISYWVLPQEASNFGLNFDGAGAAGKGFYYASGSAQGSSIYYRKITITKNSNPPFDRDIGPELDVKSQVWWTDKRCPKNPNWPGAGKCSVEMETYLTNWKDY